VFVLDPSTGIFQKEGGGGGGGFTFWGVLDKNSANFSFFHWLKLLNILIQSNFFKRSNFQGISQLIHLKDISKVNDNGN
jgi:hypothetical protein